MRLVPHQLHHISSSWLELKFCLVELCLKLNFHQFEFQVSLFFSKIIWKKMVFSKIDLEFGLYFD